MKIQVRSFPENFEKEKSGIKKATIRVLDGKDTIEITNTETNETFTRTITDISTWKGQLIISYE